MNQDLMITDKDVQTAMVPVPRQAATPMMLLELAMNQGADLDRLERLMNMQERWEQAEARKAYQAAMAKFKEHPPVLVKDKQVAFGNTKYKHAELNQVCDKVGKALSDVKISHRWKIVQGDGRITVTCTLTHIQGHSEEATLEAPPDSSGQKNAIQGIASTVSYLQRYTLLAVTGMATGEQDDDAQSASGGLAAGEVAEQCEWIENASTLEELQKLFTAAYKRAQAAKDPSAMKAFLNAKDARKKEMQ